jgi:hypothetical protein
VEVSACLIDLLIVCVCVGQYNFVHELGIWEKQSSFYFQAKSCQNLLMGNVWVSGCVGAACGVLVCVHTAPHGVWGLKARARP